MIVPFIALQQSIANSYRFGMSAYNCQQAQLGLAANAARDLSPAGMTRLAQQDMALSMQGEYAKVMFAASQAMREESAKQVKAELDQQKRMSQIWNS